MESSSVAGKIQCSESAQEYLTLRPSESGVRVVQRGQMEIKGKGSMTTFFIERDNRLRPSESDKEVKEEAACGIEVARSPEAPV